MIARRDLNLRSGVVVLKDLYEFLEQDTKLERLFSNETRLEFKRRAGKLCVDQAVSRNKGVYLWGRYEQKVFIIGYVEFSLITSIT